MHKKFVTLFSSLILLLFSATIFAAEFDSKDPYKLIKNVADSTFKHLKANQAAYQKNPNLLKEVARKDILPYVNVRYAALKALGPFARKTTKEQRDAFTDAFAEYLLSLYAQILVQYTDQSVKIEQAKPIEANRSILSVGVDIINKQRPPIKLDFKLRKNKKTSEWQAFDLQVEGVSMLDTKSSELQADLRKNGVDYVTQQLTQLAKAPIKKESKS